MTTEGIEGEGADGDAAIYDELQRDSFARSSKATSESLEGDRRMSGSEIAAFLADRRYAAVATTRRDGRPHAAMTGFWAHGGAVWLPVMAGTARTGNVRSQPYASVVVTEGEGDEHTMVTLEGGATVVDALPEGVLDAARERFGSVPDWAVAWIEVDVQRVFSFAARSSRHAQGETGPT